MGCVFNVAVWLGLVVVFVFAVLLVCLTLCCELLVGLVWLYAY